MRDIPRTLLLTATAPGDGGVGQLFLRDLIQTLDPQNLAFAILHGETFPESYPPFASIPSIHLSEESYHHRKPSWVPRTLHVMWRHLRYRRRKHKIRALADSVYEFARDNNIQQLWVVLNSPATYPLAKMVSRRLKIPLVTTVWDPPEGVGLLFGLDRLSRSVAARQFAEAVRASERCSVISERMQSDYQSTNGTPCIVLRHGISQDEPVAGPDRCSDEFLLGFCGSLYAENEWKALFRGLDHLQWQLNGRPVRVIVAGSRMPTVSSRSPARLEFLGWRDMHEVVQRMSECHTCYFPYWFNPAYRESVRYCFATKMTTYLTAGTPILYHGPADAAVMDFFRNYPVAIPCHSLEADEVARKLRQLADDEQLGVMKEAIQRAVAEELNLDVFHRRFQQLIAPLKSDPNGNLEEKFPS